MVILHPVLVLIGNVMNWQPVKVQLPLSINICVLHVLPLLCTQLVCVTGAGLCV